MDNKCLTFNFDMCDALLTLPDEQVGKMFRALALFVFADEATELTAVERALLIALKGMAYHGE